MTELLRNCRVSILLLIVVSSGIAHADNLTWDPLPANGPAGSDGNGSWQAGAGIWYNNSLTLAGQNWTNGDSAAFGAGAGGAVTIDPAGVTANGLTFNNAGYTVSGGPLTLAGPAQITAAGNATISVPIAGSAGLTKSGSGTLVLAGSNTYTGATTVSGGRLQLQAPVTAMPSDLAGLVVHLDANNVTGAGNPADQTQIGTWTNLAAGGAGNFTGAVTPYVNWTGNPMNGNSVVHFWGSTLANPVNLGNNSTVLYVGRMDGGANQRLVSANNNWLLGYWRNNMNTSYWNNGGDLSGAFDYNSHIFGGVADSSLGANGTATTYDLDSAPTVTNTHTTAGWQGPSSLFVGGYSGGEYSYGDVGELLAFNRPLTAPELAQMSQYLQAKWYGVLPADTAVDLTSAGATLDLNGVNQTIGSLAGIDGSHVELNGAMLTIGQNNGSTTFAGDIIDGAAPGTGLSKIGSGTLTLSGTSPNTFTGPTFQSQGYLELSKPAGVAAIPGDLTMVNSLSPTAWTTADNQFSPGSVLAFVSEVNSGVGNARFNLAGTTQTLAGIQQTSSQRQGVIQNSESTYGGPNNTGTSTLVLAPANGDSYSFNGYLRNLNGVLSLTKNGLGAQALVGDRINYTGPTLVNSGLLELYNTSAFNSAVTINSGGELKLTNTGNFGANAGLTIALNNGGTLTHNGLTNGNDFYVLPGAVTNSGTTTINQSSVTNLTGANKGLFLDGGLKGTGTVTINAANPGNAVIFRNNNSNFAGQLIVNGIASTTVNAGSGIGVGGATTGLQNADIELNGTMELLNQGIGWSGGAPGAFTMGALSGTGVMVGNFTGGGITTVTLGNTGNSGNFSGAIANGTGNTVHLVKTGAGTQTLSGTPTYTGNTTVNAGILSLQMAGSGSSFNSAITVNSSGTLDLTSANAGVDNWVFDTAIGGSGNITKNGAGWVQVRNSGGLSGFSGTLTINNGIFGNGYDAVGDWTGSTANAVVNSPGVLDLRTDNITLNTLTGNGHVANTYNLNPMNTLTVGNGDGSGTFSGVIHGASGGANNSSYDAGRIALTKVGTGTQTLTGINTYIGNTTVNGGILSIGNGGSIGSIAAASPVSVAAGATIKWDNNNDTSDYVVANAISGAGTVHLQASNSAGAIQNGVYQLTGNNSAFTGTWVLNRAISWNNNTPTKVGSANIDIQDRATMAFNGGTFANNITIGDQAGWHHNVGTDAVIGALRLEGTNVLTGNIVLNNTTNITLGDGTGANSAIGGWGTGKQTLSGVISGPGNLSMSRFTGWNGGTAVDLNIALTGTASNTYTGVTVVDGQHARATLNLMKTGGAVAIPANTTVWLGSNTGGQANLRIGDDQLTGATVGAARNQWDNQFGAGVVLQGNNGANQWMRFDLQGTNQTLAGVTSGTLSSLGGAIIQNQNLQNFDPGQNATLTLNGTGTYVYNGYIRDEDTGGTNRKLNLVIDSGSGSQTLAGNRINYTGTTLVNSGRLELYNATAFNSATTVNSGAELKLSNTGSFGAAGGFTIALNNGGTLTHNGLTNGNDFYVLPGAVTNSGTTTINQSSVTSTGINKSLFLDGGLKGTGTVTINAANPGNGVIFRNNSSNFAGQLIVNGIPSTTVNAGSGIGVGGATTGLQNADIELNGTMELLNQGVGWAGNAPGAFTMGALSGTGVMVGNFTSGGITTVTLGNTGNSGNFSGEIANGTGNLVHLIKTGAGTQTLSGTNTYTGNTTVSGGILQIGAGSTAGAISSSSNVAIGAGAEARWYRSDSGAEYQIGNTISGPGTLTLQGTNSPANSLQGRFQLTGNNVGLTGSLVLDSARLVTTTGSNTGSATITIKNNGQWLSLPGGGGATYSNDIIVAAGVGGWTESAGNYGQLRLEGDNTLTGTITLDGTATVTAQNSTGTSHLSGVISGVGGLTMNRLNGTSGTPNIILDGNASNTYTGTTIVDGQAARATLTLAKTGGAVAIAAGNTVQMGSNSSGQSNLRMGQSNQFGADVLMQFANASGNWTRFDLLGTSQTLAGLESLQAGGVVQNGGAGVGSATPATLTLNGSGTYYYQGHMRDWDNVGGAPLNIVKDGSGTQIFDALTTGSTSRVNYTGTTTVNDGTLILRNLRDPGAGTNFNSPVTVNAGGTLEIDSSIAFGTRWNYGQTLAGTGIINKTGNGVFGITGVNTFDGQLNILAGRLHNDNVTGNWTGATADVLVAAGAVLDLRANDIYVDSLTGAGEIWNSNSSGGNNDTLYLGVADGTGGDFSGIIRGNDSQGDENPDAAFVHVVKNGAGTQTLSGINTYGGSTTVNTGTLEIGGAGQLGSGNYGGNISLGAGTGTLKYNSSADQIFSGTVSGSGSLVKDNGSTLLLTNGSNSFSGNVDIAAGSLAVDSIGAIGSPASIHIASGASFDVRDGALSGGNFAFAGPVTVSGNGTINLGSTPGNGALVWDNMTTLAPGNSPGTFNVNGSVVAAPGGTYNWELFDANGAPGTGYDTIAITGDLNIAGLGPGVNSGIINIFGIDGSNGPALPANLDISVKGMQSGLFEILTAGSITGVFDSANFTVNAGNLAQYGYFTVLNGPNPNALYLQFTSTVPEPGTCVLLAMMAACMWLGRKRVMRRHGYRGTAPATQ